ncbi:uncharacterized protein LOC105694460 isoform X2 [Orussus abietinus]|nr:uncharacterized protein LOC105694460 isoform X2 [Orussus abietinus]
MAVPMPVVKAIFIITSHFELGPNARYLAVYLYDKFMHNHFNEIYMAEVENGLKEISWVQTCSKVSSQAKLCLMSCIQLASKMDSPSKALGISQVLCMLRCIAPTCTYTHNMIFNSEFKVFKTVGFQIPLFTPLHYIEVLLAATDLTQTPEIFNISIHLLDLAFLQHEQLYTHLQMNVHGRISMTYLDKKNYAALETNMLFLSASIVLGSTFFLCLEKKAIKNLVLKLSNLIEIQVQDILDMGNLLFSMVVQDFQL